MAIKPLTVFFWSPFCRAWWYLSLDQERQGDHDRTHDEDDEDRRPVAAVRLLEIKIADRATFDQSQETSKKLTAAATRTLASKARRERRNPGKITRFLHGTLAAKELL